MTTQIPKNCVYPTDFIYNHEYNIRNLSLDYQQSILKFKTKVLNLNCIHPNYLVPLNFKYPGILYWNEEFINLYKNNIYKPLMTKVHTVPRGLVDPASIIVVGIAPSNSEHSFGESSWLYGPSVYILHMLLPHINRFYFTNVSKTPLKKNKYDKDQVFKQSSIIEQELNFFKGNKIIFLGKYDIYDQLISKLNITNYLKVTHPAYYIRFGQKTLENERKNIENFCVSS